MAKRIPGLTSPKNKSSKTALSNETEFEARFKPQQVTLQSLYDELYQAHPRASEHWDRLMQTIRQAYHNRPGTLKVMDQVKASADHWYLDNSLAGMSLYADRFSDDLTGLKDRLTYLQDLGINLLHIMPIFKSPPEESDGGYAVSDFRAVDPRFGSLEDLKSVVEQMHQKGMYLMLDIVLNHTSDQHPWALQARTGDPCFMDYYYMYPDRTLPDQYEATLPEIFPESSPGNFTHIPECDSWVMTVFHHYQWDLNFSNPAVLVEMLDHIFFYANLGVDVLRIDAPAFIWKQLGTNCQNLPQAHTLLRLIKAAVRVATPGMALLGEAIVSPEEIMKYFGTGEYRARECDFAYNATMMALQWDALATGKTRVMRAAQEELMQKPLFTSWISYTRCHDDIGLGFTDHHIRQGGFEPFAHRAFLKDYFSGEYPGSPAKGALFSINPKTQDARISGTLASLCGLESALENNLKEEIQAALDKIILMQGHSFFIGGLPMLFYGDEVGYLNDYTYLRDKGRHYDNRWMHRPIIDWNINALIQKTGTTQEYIYKATQRLLEIRRRLSVVTDLNNIEWLPEENVHISGYLRYNDSCVLFCLFNFGPYPVYLSWYAFKTRAKEGDVLYDHWNNKQLLIGPDQEHLLIKGYGIVLAEWGADQSVPEQNQ